MFYTLSSKIKTAIQPKYDLRIILLDCSLQKFKLSVANTVVSQDNSSMHSMVSDQLLDLFSLNDGGKSSTSHSVPRPAESGKDSLKSILEGLNELWDEKQYEDEYNLDGFISSLPK